MSRINKFLIIGLVVIVAAVAGIALERFLAGQTQGMFDEINRAMSATPRPAAPVAPRVPEGTGAAGSVCYLVSDAEVARITSRQPLIGGYGSEFGGERTCYWTLYADPMEYVTLTVDRAVNHEEMRFGGEATVSGVGDDAFYGGFGLSVKKGAYHLQVSVVTETVDPKTAAVEIGRLAASRLP